LIILKIHAMSFLKIWVHVVWTTKLRKPLLTDAIRQEVFAHIKDHAARKGIYVDHINGYVDHVHCLISLGAEQSIALTVQLLKGESAFWVNKQQLLPEKFEWQHEYYAVSVSESGVRQVRQYIRNQEVHHQLKTFQEEHDAFVERFGFALVQS
jgi:putative transposase